MFLIDKLDQKCYKNVAIIIIIIIIKRYNKPSYAKHLSTADIKVEKCLPSANKLCSHLPRNVQTLPKTRPFKPKKSTHQWLQPWETFTLIWFSGIISKLETKQDPECRLLERPMAGAGYNIHHCETAWQSEAAALCQSVPDAVRWLLSLPALNVLPMTWSAALNLPAAAAAVPT